MQNGYSQQSYSQTSGGFAFDRKRYDFKSVIRVDSPAPLSDGMRCSRWLYIPGLLCFGIGAAAVYTVRVIYAEHQVTEVLRKKARFYIPNVNFTQDELLNKLGPYCAGTGMTLNVSPKGIISITRGKYIYDVHFNNDGTYGLWWRKNLVNAFFSLHGRINQYRQVAEDMGIVAYGIQTSLESIANEKGMNQ